MGVVSSLLLKIVKIMLLLIVLYIALGFTTLAHIILSRLPRKRRISPTDPIWTSGLYIWYYETREKWVYIESFVYEEFVAREKLLVGLKVDRESCEKEAVRLFWKYRNEQKGYKDPPEVIPRPPLPPIVGGKGGTPELGLEVIEVTMSSVTMLTTSIYSPEDRYRGGFELFEALWEEKGVRLRLKYAWHIPRMPARKIWLWFSIYMQVLSRSMILRKVIGEMSVVEGGDVKKAEEGLGREKAV